MTVLYCGNCERLKASVHAVALGTAALCAAYNMAAWLVRRQPHLAINAVVYSMAVIWESKHVMHHLAGTPEPVVEAADKIIDVVAAA